MILPFPYKPEDWLSIWQATKTMTLLTTAGEPITISIESVTAVEEYNCGNLEAVKVTVADGAFYLSFGDPPDSLSNQILFQVNCRDPKKGRWQVPQWYLDKCKEETDR